MDNEEKKHYVCKSCNKASLDMKVCEDDDCEKCGVEMEVCDCGDDLHPERE